MLTSMFGGLSSARTSAVPAARAGDSPAAAQAIPSDGRSAKAADGGPNKNLRMKAARVASGLSQAELAAAVGATRQTIGLIEAGGYNPTLKLCTAICKTLGCTLDDLFWEEGEERA